MIRAVAAERTSSGCFSLRCRLSSEALLNVLSQRNAAAGHFRRRGGAADSILHALLPPSRARACADPLPNNKSLYSESSSMADTFIDLLTHSVLTPHARGPWSNTVSLVKLLLPWAFEELQLHSTSASHFSISNSLTHSPSLAIRFDICCRARIARVRITSTSRRTRPSCRRRTCT